MPCSTCKSWYFIGENNIKIDGVYLNCPVGACTNTLTHDGIISSEQSDGVLSITVLMGMTTKVITKDSFGCDNFELNPEI